MIDLKKKDSTILRKVEVELEKIEDKENYIILIHPDTGSDLYFEVVEDNGDTLPESSTHGYFLVHSVPVQTDLSIPEGSFKIVNQKTEACGTCEQKIKK